MHTTARPAPAGRPAPALKTPFEAARFLNAPAGCGGVGGG